MLTPAQIEQFQRDGFLNGGTVLDEQQVEALRTELARVIEQHDTLDTKPVLFQNLSSNEQAPVWHIVNIWQASEPFRALLHHPKITGEVAQLSGAGALRVWHDQIVYKPAESGGINRWHQDSPLWPILQPSPTVSAWVALDDVDVDNGCMSMVPGSHQWGDHMQELAKIETLDALPAVFHGHEVRRVLCPVRKGEVHYHHALTWHSSHANISGRPRRAIALHYMSSETRFHAAGEHVMKPLVAVGDNEVLQGEAFPVVYKG
jgi:ectoine hydroxylase-related dioxygenase (phytanoyl-CoA dioxygenase family)